MSFSGKKKFGWHVQQNSDHTNEEPRSFSRVSQTFSAQSRRFFGFAPLPEDKVLMSLKARLENPKLPSERVFSNTAPKPRTQNKRVLPRLSTGSPLCQKSQYDRKSQASPAATNSHTSPLRSLSKTFDFSPYSSPTRTVSDSCQSQSSKPSDFNKYLGGVPDLVQLKSRSSVLDNQDFPDVFPDLHRLLTSNTSLRDGVSDSRSSTNKHHKSYAPDFDYFHVDSRGSRRIRFDDNVQKIDFDSRPQSSSNGTELSTVYIIEDVESSENSDIEDAEQAFEYNPDIERSIVAFRLGVLPDHPDLIWIVDECILESSKDPWQLCYKKNNLMYHNRKTGEV
jgi:hypothetical protein